MRSVRVVIDVGINDRGWSDEQALKYWQENVPGQDDVALREIERVRRWPAQAITYKYGAWRFEQLRERLMSRGSRVPGIAQFHDLALSYGSMPFAALDALADDVPPR